MSKRQKYGRKSENALFARLLNQRLNERKVSAHQFADALGVHHTTVYRWLNAQSVPSAREDVFRIANLLAMQGETRKSFLLAYFNEVPDEIAATESTQLVLVEPPSIEIQAPSLGMVRAHELGVDGVLGTVALFPNEMVEVRIHVRNDELSSVIIRKVVVAVRGPEAQDKEWNAETVDFRTVESVKIKPGEIYEYRQSRIFYKSGDYFMAPVYQKPSDGWEEFRPWRRLYFSITSRS